MIRSGVRHTRKKEESPYRISQISHYTLYITYHIAQRLSIIKQSVIHVTKGGVFRTITAFQHIRALPAPAGSVIAFSHRYILCVCMCECGRVYKVCVCVFSCGFSHCCFLTSVLQSLKRLLVQSWHIVVACRHCIYRVANPHKKPYLDTIFSAQEPYN